MEGHPPRPIKLKSDIADKKNTFYRFLEKKFLTNIKTAQILKLFRLPPTPTTSFAGVSTYG